LPAQAKLEAVKGLVEKLKEAKAVVFVDYKGISVNEDTELRKTARESGVEYFVAKNRLFKIALKEAGYYTLSPAEAYKALTENVLPENKKVVWLTFDDSLKDFYTQAYPILQKYQMQMLELV